MAITPRFNVDDVARRFDELLAFIDDETFEALQYVGERAVAHAKNIPLPQGFLDHTNNLRSSIGYAIYHDGRRIDAFYKGKDGKGQEGIRAGLSLADEVGADTSGWALVVTAGMYYAVHVESKGRDVLTSAEHNALQWLEGEMDNIQREVIKQWSSL